MQPPAQACEGLTSCISDHMPKTTKSLIHHLPLPCSPGVGLGMTQELMGWLTQQAGFHAQELAHGLPQSLMCVEQMTAVMLNGCIHGFV